MVTNIATSVGACAMRRARRSPAFCQYQPAPRPPVPDDALRQARSSQRVRVAPSAASPSPTGACWRIGQGGPGECELACSPAGASPPHEAPLGERDRAGARGGSVRRRRMSLLPLPTERRLARHCRRAGRVLFQQGKRRQPRNPWASALTCAAHGGLRAIANSSRGWRSPSRGWAEHHPGSRMGSCAAAGPAGAAAASGRDRRRCESVPQVWIGGECGRRRSRSCVERGRSSRLARRDAILAACRQACDQEL